MSIKLPPLRPFDTYECAGFTGKVYYDDGLYVAVEEVEARERILLARVAELEADAERYRWLRRKVCIIAKPGFMSGDSYAAFEFLDFPLPTHVAPCAGIELDAAIDAARNAK